ncbi:hypothetical protein GPNADHDJ_00179 [Stenotrophomonas maltophilia]|uniref:DUF4365 domain-containing protein n=2 Tax=Stenotrophomonas maltophilia TaxID=40324 RepID=A0AAX1I924_STEMA|nr:DUF4365 domain-containing protein [Stenotrophomonas maltophilia]QNG76013.1 hypothetical protein GPNADHDJ_00179 [Stenotrophomonas maltophilia]
MRWAMDKSYNRIQASGYQVVRSTHMSKQYPKRSINGDAGEHFAAYKFTRTLKWPCRLQSVDLGIDAELEICDQQCSATGNVVKLQIKSFQELPGSQSHNVYVDDSDIDYWQRFSVPTIIVCVDLKNEKVYWKPISATEAYASGGASRRITFDLSEDELKAEATSKISSLASPDHFKDIFDLITEAENIYKGQIASDVFDISDDELDEIHKVNDAFNSIVSRIDEIRRHYPWRVSEFSGRKIERMKAEMYRYWNSAEVSWRNGVNGM